MKKHKPIMRRMMKATTETVMAIAEDGRVTPSVEWGAGFEVLVKGELSKVTRTRRKKENNHTNLDVDV
jgi:hypothetical protein